MLPALSPELAEILSEEPQFHRDGHGRAVTYRASEKVLFFIDETVHQGWSTLETGEGVTTVIFAAHGCRHTCVSPNAAALDEIRAYCDRKAISTAGITFHVGGSDEVLPGLELAPLDLLLVDGGHGFPIPFIDWHYAARAVKVGGYLVVDDTQLWTGRALKQFLLEEPEWALEVDFAPRAVVFRRVAEGGAGREWTDQPFVRRRSSLSVPGRVVTAGQLVHDREYGVLAEKARRFFYWRGVEALAWAGRAVRRGPRA